MKDIFSNLDIKFMKRSIELAYLAKGQTSPNPAVGAVLVKNNKIIAEGYHKKAGKPHAEIEALKTLRGSAKNSILYVTLEPCSHFGKTPPCADAIIDAGIKEVIIATKDPYPKVSGRGIAKLKNAGIKVRVGLLEDEAKKLNEDFIIFHTKKRPFIHLKWAMSLDGKTSTDEGDSKWISNSLSRNYVHVLRSYYDSILIGQTTLVFDNPELNIRLKKYKGKQPKRIILDDVLNLKPSYNIFNSKGGEVIIFTTEKAYKKKIKHLNNINASIIPIKEDENGANIIEALKCLKNMGIQSIFVEGGRNVAGSFFQKKLVDKLSVFIAPKLIGGFENKLPLLTLKKSLKISDSVQIKDIKIMQFGNDVCIEGYPIF